MNADIVQMKNMIINKMPVSEEDIRQLLNSYIKDEVYNKTKQNITFKNEVLTPERTFIDSQYNEIIIEYKKPTNKLSDKSRKQLFDYMCNESDKYKLGVLTNFNEIEFYYINDTNDVELNEIFSGKLSVKSLDYLIDIFSKANKKIITEFNIDQYLGLQQNKNILINLFRKLKFDDKLKSRTKLLYAEWKKLFNLSDEYDKLDMEKKKVVNEFYESLFGEKIDTTRKEYIALFAIQTYYSIIVKLLINKLLFINVKMDKNYRSFFENIESNEYYLGKNITNLIDGDFFSWYLLELDESEFKQIYCIISDIEEVKLTSSNRLLLKYYENIFPFHVRHAMGEYYTPPYLANSVIEKTEMLFGNNDKSLKILDPTCGSGVFITEALNNGYKNVYGVDINPLAVLTSKVNYLMYNGLPESKKEIPIYLGDSTYISKPTIINDVNCLEYHLITSIQEFNTIKFTFPVEVVKSIDFFLYLDKLEIAIKQKNLDGCVRLLKDHSIFEYEKLKSEYGDMFNMLIELEKRELNSIWLKIIGNYLKSSMIFNIDIIVGNPPWVRWSNLPDKYRELIKGKCRIDGIFSDDKNVGGVDLNICALIAYISFRDRLSNDGVLGFLMPDSILFNKSFEGFRRFEFEKDDNKTGYLTEVIRWNKKSEKPFDPVSLSFAEFYYTNRNNNGEVKVFDRNEGISKMGVQLSLHNNNYSIVTKQEHEGIKSVLGENKLKFRSGISLLKNGHYQLRFIENIDDKIARFKVDGKNTILELEKEIISPFIKAPDIQDNIIEKAQLYCIYPYEFGSKVPYSQDVLKTRFPKFYNYFNTTPVQESLNSSSSFNKRVQNVANDIGIFRVGEYTYSDYFLATRDNTKSSFAKISKLKTHWGEMKMPLFDSHVNYVSRDENDKPISLNQLNDWYDKFTNPFVKIFIKLSSDSRSISGKLYNSIKLDK